jgi:peptide/nickel transport system ATP-binding protein
MAVSCFITHDLGVMLKWHDNVVVMYAGRIIEKGTALETLKIQMHPYTIVFRRANLY